MSLEIDATQFHTYAAAWEPEGVTFFVDGRRVKAVQQSPTYPMQLMLGIYEFDRPPLTHAEGSQVGSYPKELTVDFLRAHRLAPADTGQRSWTVADRRRRNRADPGRLVDPVVGDLAGLHAEQRPSDESTLVVDVTTRRTPGRLFQVPPL